MYVVYRFCLCFPFSFPASLHSSLRCCPVPERGHGHGGAEARNRQPETAKGQTLVLPITSCLRVGDHPPSLSPPMKGGGG